VVFDGFNIKPKWFMLDNKKYNVSKTTYTWRTIDGEAVVIHFAVTVTDSSTLYELSFNQKTLVWRLEKTEC